MNNHFHMPFKSAKNSNYLPLCNKKRNIIFPKTLNYQCAFYFFGSFCLAYPFILMQIMKFYLISKVRLIFQSKLKYLSQELLSETLMMYFLLIISLLKIISGCLISTPETVLYGLNLIYAM